MSLLVSDANVLLDLEIGGLLPYLFRQEYGCVIPDVLFYEELEERHAHLLELGLELMELDADAVNFVQALVERHRGVSRNDCMALALARTQAMPLLTGDAALRAAAGDEQVEVVGTIWVVDGITRSGAITVDQARQVYATMRAASRRLPWDVAAAHLDEIEAGTFLPRDPFQQP